MQESKQIIIPQTALTEYKRLQWIGEIFCLSYERTMESAKTLGMFNLLLISESQYEELIKEVA